MFFRDLHLSDQQLLLDVDGELSGHDKKCVEQHLSACWKCRARRQQLEKAISDFVLSQEREFDSALPPLAGPRALLKARLAQIHTNNRRSHRLRRLGRSVWAATAACCVIAFGVFLWNIEHHKSFRPAPVVSMPDSRVTPGATILESRTQVCTQNNANNKPVPLAIRRKVFDEYGIKGAAPQFYEVDYLVTPALGGSDDIHNLWPQSYSAVWNARVKDELEDRLREMVCNGSVSLPEAQQEIAADWIGAYKKYFRTDRPLPSMASNK